MTCWDALVSYICTIWICLLGFLCGTMFTVGLRREKGPSAIFFDNLLDMDSYIDWLNFISLHKLTFTTWHDEATICLCPILDNRRYNFFSLVVSQIFIVRKQLKQNAAVENAHQRRSVIRPTLCLTMFFCLLFMPLLLFTVQLCVQDEGYYANASLVRNKSQYLFRRFLPF